MSVLTPSGATLEREPDVRDEQDAPLRYEPVEAPRPPDGERPADHAANGFGYRPALDGLRAVAVIAVITYHAGARFLPGGLLGVDAFFVLSGFLITLLLLGEHERTGSVRLRRFWAARARRLLPALLLLLAAVAVYAATIARPSEISTLRADALSTLGYIANWHFAFTDQSYFDHFAVPSPLLHLWSLGVEEQFYLLWPALIALVLRRRGRRAVLVLAALLAVISAATAAGLALAGTDASRIYYGTDTRMQALAVGGVLAVLLSGSVPRRRLSRIGLALLGLLGAAGFGACLVLLDGEAPILYQGGFLLVALLVAAVIASVFALPRSPMARLLAVPPLRLLGRISYGLYLWHWPIFLVLTAERTGLEPLPLLALRLGVLLATATLSFVLLEQPIRARRLRIPRPRLAVPVAISLLVVGLVAATSAQPPAASRAEQPQALDALQQQVEQEAAAPSAPPPPTGPIRPARMMLLGDSVALTLGAGLKPVQQSYDVDVRNYGWVGCGIARKTRAYDGSAYFPAWEDCARWPDQFAEWRDDYKPDVAVLLAGRWEVVDRKFEGRWTSVGDPAYDAYLADEFDTAIEVLSREGAKVVLMTAPVYDARELADGSSSPIDDPERVARFNELVRDAVARHPDVASLYDLEALLTPGGKYKEVVDGVKPRYDDGIHISIAGGKLVAATLLPEVRRLADMRNDEAGSSETGDEPAREEAGHEFPEVTRAAESRPARSGEVTTRVPALDGIRGLAILAVLVFHTGAGWAEGGSVGVDVFFVLSGFLITSQLLAEVAASGTVRLRSFYARRALRLMPALLLLCAGVLAYAALAPEPVGTVQLERGLLGTVFYVSDLQAAAGALPMLSLLEHTWSLSIEEHFYLIWPLLLILAVRTGGIRRLTQVTVAVAAVSAVLPLLLWDGEESIARLYYAPDTRAQQLLVGCLLALALRHGAPELRRRLLLVASYAAPAALLALLGVVVLGSWRSAGTYLGGLTLFAVLAAVLVATSVAPATSGTAGRLSRPVVRLLSVAPLVGLGRISYGLYLWHWPVYLVLNGAFLGMSFWPTQVIRVSVALLIAVTSYRVVEKPFLRLQRHVRPLARSAEPDRALAAPTS